MLKGTLAWILILPLDIVKTRQQSTRENLNILQTFKRINLEHGMKGYFTLGLVPLVVRGFLVNATTFAFYIQSLKFLDKF